MCRQGILLVFLIPLCAGACVYDRNERCGPHQHLDDGLCACDADSILDAQAGTCLPCGANELASGSACVCAAGFSRKSAALPCTAKPAGLGDACDSGTPCAVAPYTTCAPGGYCTSAACASSADCAEGWTCVPGAPSYCRRPAVGQGTPCANAGPCAGTQATWCESFTLKMCVVEGCSVSDPLSCDTGWTCCDTTKLGLAKTLCLPTPVCP